MSFLTQFFAKRSSAPVARDRLQILLAHERSSSEGQSELIAKLREEILDVIARHVPIDRDKVQIKLDRGAAVSTLEIDIEVPQLKKIDIVEKKPDAIEAGIKKNLETKADPASGKQTLPTGP
ncbi:MAG: cell division topological specificity factor MinE [Janthinobacterium lividum]